MACACVGPSSVDVHDPVDEPCVTPTFRRAPIVRVVRLGWSRGDFREDILCALCGEARAPHTAGAFGPRTARRRPRVSRAEYLAQRAARDAAWEKKLASYRSMWVRHRRPVDPRDALPSLPSVYALVAGDRIRVNTVIGPTRCEGSLADRTGRARLTKGAVYRVEPLPGRGIAAREAIGGVPCVRLVAEAGDGARCWYAAPGAFTFRRLSCGDDGA